MDLKMSDLIEYVLVEVGLSHRNILYDRINIDISYLIDLIV